MAIDPVTGAILASSAMNYLGGQSAASAAARGARQNLDFQRQMYEDSMAMGAPYRSMGNLALAEMAGALGMSSPYGAERPSGTTEQRFAGYRLPSGEVVQNLNRQQREMFLDAAGDFDPSQLKGLEVYETVSQGPSAEELANWDLMNQAYQRGSGYDVSSMPGFDEGLKAVQMSQAARSGRYTGRAIQELSDYGGSQFDKYLGRLSQLAGLGTTGSNTPATFAPAIGGAMGNVTQAQMYGAAVPYQAAGGALNNMAFNQMMQGGGQQYPSTGGGSSWGVDAGMRGAF